MVVMSLMSVIDAVAVSLMSVIDAVAVSLMSVIDAVAVSLMSVSVAVRSGTVADAGWQAVGGGRKSAILRGKHSWWFRYSLRPLPCPISGQISTPCRSLCALCLAPSPGRSLLLAKVCAPSALPHPRADLYSLPKSVRPLTYPIKP